MRVDNIAPSIHDHREPQRRNKQTPHLAQHTCTHTGTKYKHTSIEHCDKCKVWSTQINQKVNMAALKEVNER